MSPQAIVIQYLYNIFSTFHGFHVSSSGAALNAVLAGPLNPIMGR